MDRSTVIVRHSFRGKRRAPVLVTSAIGACVPIWGTSTNVSHSERRLNRLLRAEINTHGDNVWHPSAVTRRKGGRSVLCGRFLLAHPPFDGAFHSCRGVEGEGCPHLSIHMIRRNTRGMVVVPPQDGPPYVCVRAWTRAACDVRCRPRRRGPCVCAARDGTRRHGHGAPAPSGASHPHRRGRARVQSPSSVHARDRPGSSDGTSEIGVRVQEVPWPARHASGHPNTYASTATALRHRRMRHGAVKPRFAGVVATRAFCFSAHMSRERVMLSRDTVVWRACGLLLAVELERDRINKYVHVSK